MTDAEREELKTLIRETIREMAKEAGQIILNSPIPGPKTVGEHWSQFAGSIGTTRPNDGSVDPMFGVPIGGPIGGW